MANTETVERRKAQRYYLALPIQVVRLSQQRVNLAGKTRDLSSGGAYFVVAGAFEKGSPIEFFVTLQEEQPAVKKQVRLRCLGHVTRLDKLGATDRFGVAATIDRYQFVRESLN